MILFLDFDGVLHTWGSPRDEFFCYLPRLEAVLREYKHVQVVVSSDWRFSHSLEELKAKFSPDIAERVIGKTPSLMQRRAAYEGLRRREATKFLNDNKLDQTLWCALDDLQELWEPIDRRIIVCPNEFGKNEERRLRVILEAQSWAGSFRNDD